MSTASTPTTPSTPAGSPFTLSDEALETPAFLRRAASTRQAVQATLGIVPTPQPEPDTNPIAAAVSPAPAPGEHYPRALDRVVDNYALRNELDHLKAALAKKYVPTLLRRVIGWFTGIEDNRAVMAELSVMRDQGAKKIAELSTSVAQLERTQTTGAARIHDLIAQQVTLAEAIESRVERDQLREVTAQLKRNLARTSSDLETKLHTIIDLERMITQDRADYDAACLAYEKRITEMQKTFAAIHDTAALLDLKAAFLAARTDTNPKKIESAIKALEKAHDALAQYAEAIHAPFPGSHSDEEPAAETDPVATPT